MDPLPSLSHALKNLLKGNKRARLQKNLLNALPFWAGAFVTGLVSVLYARLFSWAETGSFLVYQHSRWLMLGLSPLCFLLAWWLVKRFAPMAKGSGIPQVSAAIELASPRHNYKVNRLLSLPVILIKILSSLTMIFGGGITGREGPTIQISASIFKKINDLLPAWYPKISKRNMIVTGAAAGLASAFNTPLGGIVFAIEELTKTHISFFKSALLTGVIIAGLTTLNILGPYLYLGYPSVDSISLWIITLIVPVALITGFAGSGLGYIIIRLLKKLKGPGGAIPAWLIALLCGALIAALAVFANRDVMGSGRDTMLRILFTGNKQVAWYLPPLRIFGSIISYISGGAGGIFAPALSAGATIGAVISGWFHLSAPATNLIILCGMTGFLTGITRSPFTSSILVIEMTNDHNIIFFLMLAALLANLTAQVVTKHSFYDYLKDQFIQEIHQTETQEPAVP